MQAVLLAQYPAMYYFCILYCIFVNCIINESCGSGFGKRTYELINITATTSQEMLTAPDRQAYDASRQFLCKSSMVAVFCEK